MPHWFMDPQSGASETGRHAGIVEYLKWATDSEYEQLIDACMEMADHGVAYEPKGEIKNDGRDVLMQELLVDSNWKRGRALHTERLLRRYLETGHVDVNSQIRPISGGNDSLRPAVERCVSVWLARPLSVLIEFGACTEGCPPEGYRQGVNAGDFDAYVRANDAARFQTALWDAVAQGRAMRLQQQMHGRIAQVPDSPSQLRQSRRGAV